MNRSAKLEADLLHAVAAGQFVLHYQRQVDDCGQITGAEALLRWRHPQRGLLAPAEFLREAEALGLTQALGRWVLATACAQLTDWAADPETAELDLAVNISAGHFRRPELVADVQAVLAASDADPRHLRLELAEAPLLEDPDDTLAKLRNLKKLGVSLALDNFGIGYCSLSYLKRLPLDQLKIAPAFVREVLAAADDEDVADRFVALVEGLGLAIMAEGIETVAQRDYLARHGCRVFQGYLFGRPAPADELGLGARPQRRRRLPPEDADRHGGSQ